MLPLIEVRKLNSHRSLQETDMAEIFNLMVSSKVVQFTDDFLYPLFDLRAWRIYTPFRLVDYGNARFPALRRDLPELTTEVMYLLVEDGLTALVLGEIGIRSWRRGIRAAHSWHRGGNTRHRRRGAAPRSSASAGSRRHNQPGTGTASGDLFRPVMPQLGVE